MALQKVCTCVVSEVVCSKQCTRSLGFVSVAKMALATMGWIAREACCCGWMQLGLWNALLAGV